MFVKPLFSLNQYSHNSHFFGAKKTPKINPVTFKEFEAKLTNTEKLLKSAMDESGGNPFDLILKIAKIIKEKFPSMSGDLIGDYLLLSLRKIQNKTEDNVITQGKKMSLSIEEQKQQILEEMYSDAKRKRGRKKPQGNGWDIGPN